MRELKKDASPQERHQSQEALKRSDPGNPLPNYLLAFGLFQIVLFAASACPTDKNPGVTRRSDFQFC